MTTVHAELVRRLVEAFSNGDIGVIDEIVSPDYIQHNPAAPPGRAGLKEIVGHWSEAVPDLEVTAEDVVEQGDKVALRTTFRGTHKGEVFGVPGSGKRFRFGTMDIFRVEDGKLAEHWDEIDVLGFMRQVGALPAGNGDASTSPASGS
jgi:steroid delta-isomerase-like uncharacterized protein